jgi:hypothetical protein
VSTVAVAFQQVRVKAYGDVSKQCVEPLRIRGCPITVEDSQEVWAAASDVLPWKQVVDNEVSNLVRQG